MKKVFFSFGFVALGLSMFAFSPINSQINYNESNKSDLKLDKEEVSSFTEMYTRTFLSDQTVWSHRYKEFTITSSTSNVVSVESALNRN